MSGPDGIDVADVVARFFEWRRSGRRASIDQVLDALGQVDHRSRTRAVALGEIAKHARTESLSRGSPAPDDQASATPGELPELEGYHIIDCVGRGGMGVVYEAYQRSTGRRVAIKFMLETAAANEAARRRFEREVELVARLDHPHIVSVLDSGIHRGRYFCVMDYIDGRPLDAVFPPGSCDAPQTLRLMHMVCVAVDYAHQRGVLHRDLKPSNILIDERGAPHVLDFGLAKAIEPGVAGGLELTLSEPGQLIGTLAYMSPEQSRGEYKQMSVRSDVYSLGALTYELLTGQLPCDVDGPLGDVLQRIARDDPGRPSALRHKLGADIDAILLKALSKEPHRRYATAGELASDIRRHLNNETIAARKQSRVYLLRKAITRHRGWVALGALALTALVTVAVAASIVAVQRQIVIGALEKQAQERDARLAAADARQAALTHYYQAVDLVQRKVRRADAMALLNRALEIDPTLSAARLERGVLRGVHEAFTRALGRRGEVLPTLRRLLSDFDRAHEYAGGDWLVDPATSRRLSPAEARALPTDGEGRLLAFPDVGRRADGSLVRVKPDGEHTRVGGPGFPRALVTAGNLLAAHLRQSPSGQQQDVLVADLMDEYYERAALLDPADAYARLSRALAAAARPARQSEAARLLHALVDDAEVTALAELWQALAEVHVGGPRRLYPEFHVERDPEAAERAAREVTTLRPDDIYGWYLLGLALQQQRRYVEAIRANEQGWTVLQHEERRRAWDADGSAGSLSLIGPPLLTNLATCHAMLSDFEPAWPLYQQALDESKSRIVRLERAEAYHLAGMTAEAQADLQRPRKRRTGEGVPYPATTVPTAWALLTFPDAGLRDPAAARRLLARLRKRELWQDDPVALTLLSYASVLSGEAEAASELLHRIPATAEPRPFRDAVWAAVLHAGGEREQARQRLEQAEAIAQGRAYPDPRLTRLIEQVRLQLANKATIRPLCRRRRDRRGAGSLIGVLAGDTTPPWWPKLFAGGQDAAR